MITISSAEFQRHFGRYQDEALTQPVAITRNGRERVVILSVNEYRRLKRRAREALPVGALSNAEREAIAGTEMAPHHRHLDREIDAPLTTADIADVCNRARRISSKNLLLL